MSDASYLGLLIGFHARSWAGRCRDVVRHICLHPKAIQYLNLRQPTFMVALGEWGGQFGGSQANNEFRRLDDFTAIDHIWLQRPDGKIVDPTLWSMIGSKSFIYFGVPGGHKALELMNPFQYVEWCNKFTPR